MIEEHVLELLDEIKNVAAESFTSNLIAFYSSLDPDDDIQLRDSLRKDILDRLGMYDS